MLYTMVGITTSIYANPAPRECPVWMTIFIHGAVMPRFCTSDLLNVMRDHVEDSAYDRAVAAVRNDPFFRHNQAMQGLGLKPVQAHPGGAPSGACAVASLYDYVTKTVNDTPTTNLYYTFGWSGLLSASTRYAEAQLLYDSLAREIKKLTNRYGTQPKLRIVAYSHGGNIMLNLGKVRQEQQSHDLYVDEAVMLGVPICCETDKYVADTLFKKVYVFYSTFDRIQTKDFFSFKRFFAKRSFHSRSNFTVPDYVTQVQIKAYFYKPRSKYKDNQQAAKDLAYNPHGHKKFKKRNYSPGHTELWFLGGGASHYRENFPLYPAPLAAVTPAIIKQLETQKTGQKLVVELHPQRNIMRIRTKPSLKHTETSFIELKAFGQLQTIAALCKPGESLKKEGHRRRNLARVQSRPAVYHPKQQSGARKRQAQGLCFTEDEISIPIIP